MSWYLYVASYFGIGFLFLVAAFILVGPRDMWFILVSKDDDYFGAWLTVFIALFMWPAVVAVGSLMGVVWVLAWLARWISEGIVKAVKAVKSVAARSAKAKEGDAV